MKIERLIALLLILLLSVGLLSACNKPGDDSTTPEQTETEAPPIKDAPFEPTESAVFVRDDGTMIGAEVSDFSKDYYDLTELKTYVEGLVKEYNQKKAGLEYAYAADAPSGKKLPAAISKLETGDGKVVLMLECQTPADYIRINDLDLTADGLQAVTKTTIKEMNSEGKVFEVKLVNVKGESVTGEQALRQTDYHVVIVEGATVLQVQGEVKYMSTNVTYVDYDCVKTPAGEVSYIIYR